VGGGVSAPKPVFSPDPEYSEEAPRQSIRGQLFSVWWLARMDVREMKVLRSLGLGLDEKAIEAVKNWRFDPAVKDNKPSLFTSVWKWISGTRAFQKV
jgi:protein TonB